MKLSAKTEYACLAMLELAAHYGSPEPLRIRAIADQHGMPSRFLVQILLQLKGAGLVTSTRGASGGYQLARPPDAISLGEVMAVMEGPELGSSGEASADQSAAARVLEEAWQEIGQVQRDLLYGLTLGDLAERVRRQVENMYYI